MKISKTTREVWISKKLKDETVNTNKKITTTYDIDIDPKEFPELIDNCIRAGIGDVKPILKDLLDNFKKVK